MSNNIEKIRKLRDFFRHGAGISLCKKALLDADGDMEKAKELVRKMMSEKSIKVLEKGAETREGVVLIHRGQNMFFCLKVSSVTDFVCNGKEFVDFLIEIGNFIIANEIPSIELLLDNNFIKNKITEMRSFFSENVSIDNYIFKKYKYLNSCGYYAHNLLDFKDENFIFAKKIALIFLTEDKPLKASVKEVDSIALQVLALRPLYIYMNKIPAEVIDAEKVKIEAQIDIKNKPKEIVEKIMNGKMSAYYDENIFEEQASMNDVNVKIRDWLISIDPNIIIDEFYIIV